MNKFYISVLKILEGTHLYKYVLIYYRKMYRNRHCSSVISRHVNNMKDSAVQESNLKSPVVKQNIEHRKIKITFSDKITFNDKVTYLFAYEWNLVFCSASK